MPLLFVILGFVLGAIPFSFLLGKWFLKTDIRLIGDHNPGATNVFRAGNKWLGIAALALDYLKGFVLVILFLYMPFLLPIWLVFVSLAPVFGHAFSPFLKGKGGKAIATTFGVWSGLTLWQAPVIMGTILVATHFLKGLGNFWRLCLCFAFVLALCIAFYSWDYSIICVVNAALVLFKHKDERAFLQKGKTI